jgi:hypothetical protein
MAKTKAGRQRLLPARRGAEIMGAWAKTIRGSRTMAEVARQAGTSVSVVCDMEHGRLLPSEPNLRAILCQGCGMTGEAFEDLLFDFYLEYFVQSDERLSEDAKARIRDFARAERPG